ncbi:MFS transporter [Nakamurella sp. YIM 132087]|uniref:MFS transporter n=1 Tax=Nakamurella alba TaxID=2665158 RepID=A0A7K1FQL7_9ACTN|nr:MFS transporter [Nakamurella alba]MTD16438.1 MFS transporter [Nakamurella alba]
MSAVGAGQAWRGYERGEPEYRRISWGLFAAGFATFAQIFDAQAVLPAVSRDLGIEPSTAALSVSAATIGLAVSVLPWAWAADRIGRIRAMQISLFAALALSLVAPLMPSFAGVVAVRGLTGLALGAVPGVAVAYLTEELGGRWVSLAAGTYVAGNTFGGVVGRLVAGPIAETWSWRAGLLVVAGLCAIAGVVFVLVIPPPRGFTPNLPQPHPLPVRVLFHLRDPMMMGLYAQGLLLMGSFAAVYNYLGFRLVRPPFDIPTTVVGFIFIAYLAGTAASRVSALLATRHGPLRVILAGILTMLAGMLLMLFESLPLILLGLVVFTVGCFSAHPVASGLSGRRAQLGRAQATALYQLSWLTGTALCGWIAGLVFERAGWGATTLLVVGFCCAAAVLALLGLRLLRNRRPPVPPARVTGAA